MGKLFLLDWSISDLYSFQKYFGFFKIISYKLLLSCSIKNIGLLIWQGLVIKVGAFVIAKLPLCEINLSVVISTWKTVWDIRNLRIIIIFKDCMNSQIWKLLLFWVVDIQLKVSVLILLLVLLLYNISQCNKVFRVRWKCINSSLFLVKNLSLLPLFARNNCYLLVKTKFGKS